MGMRQQITIFWANSSLPPDVWEGNTNEAEPTTILVPSASRFKIPILRIYRPREQKKWRF